MKIIYLQIINATKDKMIEIRMEGLNRRIERLTIPLIKRKQYMQRKRNVYTQMRDIKFYLSEFIFQLFQH